jgi:hypothetical protein
MLVKVRRLDGCKVHGYPILLKERQPDTWKYLWEEAGFVD